MSVEIADPSKIGPTGATIVSAEINNDSVLDFLMCLMVGNVVVDNWYNSADSVEQVFTASSSLLSSRVVKMMEQTSLTPAMTTVTTRMLLWV